VDTQASVIDGSDTVLYGAVAHGGERTCFCVDYGFAF
jgi:hypothetical protein